MENLSLVTTDNKKVVSDILKSNEDQSLPDSLKSSQDRTVLSKGRTNTNFETYSWWKLVHGQPFEGQKKPRKSQVCKIAIPNPIKFAKK